MEFLKMKKIEILNVLRYFCNDAGAKTMIENRYTQENIRSKTPFIAALYDSGLSPHDGSKTVYKYVSVKTATAILENSNLRFSSPAIFNDPFELNTGFVDYNIAENILRKRLLTSWWNSTVFASPRSALEEINQLSHAKMIEQYKQTLLHIRQNCLMLCTSRTNMSTLMWSHYADNHKGVCIGLTIPTANEYLELFTFNVNYVHEIKPLQVLHGTDQERGVALYTWMNTKSKVWEYEQEVRTCTLNISGKIPANKDLYCLLNFDLTAVNEIYYGVSTSQEDKRSIDEIINRKGYKIEKWGQMNISRATFNLECIPR